MNPFTYIIHFIGGLFYPSVETQPEPDHNNKQNIQEKRQDPYLPKRIFDDVYFNKAHDVICPTCNGTNVEYITAGPYIFSCVDCYSVFAQGKDAQQPALPEPNYEISYSGATCPMCGCSDTVDTLEKQDGRDTYCCGGCFELFTVSPLYVEKTQTSNEYRAISSIPKQLLANKPAVKTKTSVSRSVIKPTEPIDYEADKEIPLSTRKYI